MVEIANNKILEYEKKNVELIKNEKKSLADFYEGWISDLIAERDQERESKNVYMKQLEEYKEKIRKLENNSDYEENVMETAEKDLQEATSKHAEIGKDSAQAITGNDSGIELNIDAVTQEIKDHVEILVNEKLSEIGIKHSREKDLTVPGNDTKERLSGSLLRKNTTKEDIRDLSIIIHGINESETPDDFFIKELFDILEVNSGPMIAHRLGEKKEDRGRPIKIVMETKKHKAEFMTKLWKLRYAGPAHKEARITDDYTWEERQEIRRWVKMAKDKNQKDDEQGMKDHVWKVRGTPKSGLRLVQIRKQ